MRLAHPTPWRCFACGRPGTQVDPPAAQMTEVLLSWAELRPDGRLCPYADWITTSEPPCLPDALAVFEDAVQRAHGGAPRLHCGLKQTHPMASDNLTPSCEVDQLKWLLHITDIVRACGPHLLSRWWPITFDEDTYTRFVHRCRLHDSSRTFK